MRIGFFPRGALVVGFLLQALLMEFGFALSASHLRCENLTNPLGIGETGPRLGWIVEASYRGARQTAYELLVASSAGELSQDHGNLWSSGKVSSDETVHVSYSGTPLTAREHCYWKVRVWDEHGVVGDWSSVAEWEMGLLRPEDWKAGWIESAPVPRAGGQELRPGSGTIPYLRRNFTLSGDIVRARLYATALGVYEIHLNGKKVGDEVLAPGWTDYAKRLRYQTYDVTGDLKKGDNAMGAWVANGWYCGHLGNGGFQQYGKTPALLAQLEVTFADGTRQVIGTDSEWRLHSSPLLTSDLLLGEEYDARDEIEGWDKPGLDESSWSPAPLRSNESRNLEWPVSQPIRQVLELPLRSLSEPVPGRYTFDLGQNMVGVVRIRLRQPAGTVVTLRHAEMLSADGTVYTTNLRRAASTDTYTCRGGKEEVWQPRFTFHGFRYVEVSGLKEKPAMDSITGVVLTSDTPEAGTFSCSDARVNQLFSNIRWGQRGNYLSVPTDCPQRDERLGWMGDAQVFVRTATDLCDIEAFFTKWLVDVDDAQKPDGAFTDVSPFRAANAGTPAWADAGVICPWTIYEAYDDKKLLATNLPSMKRWVDWCQSHSVDLIRSKSMGGNYGDWLSIGANTPKDLIGTAYFAYSTDLVARSCDALGQTEQAAHYHALFGAIRTAFQKAYVSPDGHIKGDTQCGDLMALHFNLLPDELRPAVVKNLVSDLVAKNQHLSTGFVGVGYLLPVLAESDQVDEAYDILLQDSFPSWLFSVKHGATTIWERWNGWTPEKGFENPGMNSFNHYSLGSCGQWLFSTVAGIDLDPAQPGYKHVIVHPRPGTRLSWAKATLSTVHGANSVSWKWEDHQFSLDCSIPANTTARIYLPASSGKIVTEGGIPLSKVEGVRIDSPSGSDVTVEVGSGTYHFVVTR